jgi:hypothetical protein
LEEQAKQESKKASTAPKSKEEKNPRRGDKKPCPPLKNEPRRTEPPRFQKEVFTPLNTSLTEAFSAIKGDLAFRWPQKMKADPFKRDRSKFCEYHADHGHLTEDCISLHREIEVFLQNGKLVRFLAQERTREANQQGRREGLGRAEPRYQGEAPRTGQRDREEGQRNVREEQQPHPNHEVVWEIHTIFGGITGGRESNSARKTYARSMQG